MLIAVDGTGPWDNEDYAKEMKESFVSRIVRDSTQEHKIYFRGPEGAGLIKITSPAVLAWGIEWRYKKGDPIVFLTGYSRGAATVINAATLLKAKNIPVEAMFLFDAVDRTTLLEAETIPSNVKHCYHAIRSSEAQSRWYFGNCGLVSQNGTLKPEPFFTTHGGMGGTPWGEKGLIKPPHKASILDMMLTGPLWSGAIGPEALIDLNLTPKQIAEDLVRRHPEIYANKINEGSPDWMFTRVTPELEKIGMDKVYNWMWPHLRKHGVIA